MDPIDWPAFFDRYTAIAESLARGLTGGDERARRVVQEASRRVYERSDAVSSTKEARNELLKEIRILSAEHVYGAAVAAEAEPLAPEIRTRHDGTTRGESIATAVKALGFSERELVRERFVEGKTFREISERSGETMGTVHEKVDAVVRKIHDRVDGPAADAAGE